MKKLIDELDLICGITIVGDAVCETLRPLLAKYIEETVSELRLEWKLEQTEYGE